jgi:hypothetical protein
MGSTMAIEHNLDSATIPLPDRELLAKLRAAPSPGELTRRQQVFAEIMRLREEIGPIKGLTTADLLVDDEEDE